jgi:hypothetical protein
VSLHAVSAPDLIDPVVGFRQWRLIGGALCSPYRRIPWWTAELHATCAAAEHDSEEVPAAECSCGVYALYDPNPRTASVATDWIAGAVVLWGTLQLHGEGMRATHARIVALAQPLSRGRKRQGLSRAADALEVPLVAHRQLERVAARQGASLPKSLRPPRQRVPVRCPTTGGRRRR